MGADIPGSDGTPVGRCPAGSSGRRCHWFWQASIGDAPAASVPARRPPRGRQGLPGSAAATGTQQGVPRCRHPQLSATGASQAAGNSPSWPPPARWHSPACAHSAPRPRPLRRRRLPSRSATRSLPARSSTSAGPVRVRTPRSRRPPRRPTSIRSGSAAAGSVSPGRLIPARPTAPPSSCRARAEPGSVGRRRTDRHRVRGLHAQRRWL